MGNQVEITGAIIEIVQSGAGEALVSYTEWHARSALAWAVAGTVFLCFAVVSAIIAIAEREARFWLVSGLCMLVGICVVASNYPTYQAPEAYAIHQLIKDVRG